MINKNIFSIDFFKKENTNIICNFEYDTEYERYVVYANEEIIYESNTEPRGTFWISFFDTKRYEYGLDFEVNFMHSLINQFTEEIMHLSKERVDSFLLQYKKLVEKHPFFLMYYTLIFEIISPTLLYNQNMQALILDIHTKILDLSTAYTNYDKYINDTLVAPYQNGINHCTGTIVARIESLYAQLNEPTPYSKYITTNENLYLYNDTSGIITNDYDFSKQFPLGIDYFIEKNYIFKQCPICLGYFKANRNTNITYCNRIFRNKLTCQEIGANNKHQEKIASNPIHSEYKKYYKKIWARVKRNKLTKEQAYFDELKALHSKYTNLYDIALSDSDKKDVITAFVADMNSLYNNSN